MRFKFISMTSTRQAVQVELYADGINGDGSAAAGDDTRFAPLAGALGGHVYSAAVPATRPATDYTVRVIPHFPGVAVPLEAGHILWQR